MSNDCTADINVQKRINKCRQAYYSLDNTGMPYTGLPIDIQMYLYKSVCLPTLQWKLCFCQTINKETGIFSELPDEAFIRLE